MPSLVKETVSKVASVLRDESAATAVEYSLIAALMSMAGITAFIAMGDTLAGLWQSVGEDIDNGVN